jgi:hypothetical protein
MKKSSASLIALFLLTCLSFAQVGEDTDTGNAGEVKDPNPPVAVGGPLPEATGGPDAYGYIWSDEVPYQMVDISATSTTQLSGDDVSTGAIALVNPIDFYGVSYSSLNMTSNGYISTDPTDTGPDLSNDCPLPTTPSTGGGARIYPLHDDLVLDPGGVGHHQYFASCPRPADRGGDMGCNIFMWDDVVHFGDATPFDVEVIVYDSGDIVQMVGAGNPELGSGSTTGIQNDGATIGLTYACDTANSVPDGTVVAFWNPDFVPVSIPTLGEYGLMAFVLVLMGAGVFFMRRQRA